MLLQSRRGSGNLSTNSSSFSLSTSSHPIVSEHPSTTVECRVGERRRASDDYVRGLRNLQYTSDEIQKIQIPVFQAFQVLNYI